MVVYEKHEKKPFADQSELNALPAECFVNFNFSIELKFAKMVCRDDFWNITSWPFMTCFLLYKYVDLMDFIFI